MISVAICDDNALFLDKISLLSKILLKKQSIDYVIYKFNNGNDLLDYCINKGNLIDIILLDIELGDSNGLDICKKITKKHPLVQIIYINGHIEYARSICTTKYQNFVIKPIDATSLDYVLKGAIDNIKESNTSYIAVTFDGKTDSINTNEIIYCESRKRIVVFHTLQRDISSYMKIGELEVDLPSNFLRIHKSFIINLDYIKSLNASNVLLSDETVLPIPQKKHAHIKEYYLNYIKSSM